MKAHNLLTPLLALSCLYLPAATPIGVQKQAVYWTRASLQMQLHPKARMLLQGDNRRFFSPNIQHQGMFRFGCSYLIPKYKWEFYTGFATFFNQPNDEFAEPRPVRHELRPEIWAVNQQSFGKLVLSQRYRIDFRFTSRINQSGYDPTYRFRFQLAAEYPIFKTQNGRGSVSARAFEEIFLHTGETVRESPLDQNRIGGGLSIELLKNTLFFEPSYFWLYQQRNPSLKSNPRAFSRHVLMMNVLLRLDFTKKKKEPKS